MSRIHIALSGFILLQGFSLMAAQVIAHRGASFDAPENTLSSLRLGFEQGADAGECDIHLTRDGKIVVMHDYDTLRTAGVSNRIAVTDSGALLNLPVGQWGKWQGSAFKDKVPTLEQLLSLIPEGKRLFIEIKCGPEVLPELERVLRNSGKKPSQTPLIGFDYDTVRQAKARMPQLEVSWLAAAEKKTKQFPPVSELISKAKSAGLDGLDLHQGFPIDRAFVEQVHQAGLKLYVWTVDDPQKMQQLRQAGVDGITTNRPKVALGKE